MKKKIILSIASILSIALFWQCSDKNETGSTDLKSSLNYRVSLVNKAIGDIRNTQGFKIIALQDNNSLKYLSTEGFKKGDSIELSDIKGIYEYHPLNYKKWCFFCFDRLFKKTGDSSVLFVKLPKEKIFYPHRFNNMMIADSTLKNNFEITATDYHFYLYRGFIFDYKLAAAFKLDNLNIGSLSVTSYLDTTRTSKYDSHYTFENGYGIDVYFKSGDTAVSSFALTDANGVLLKESVKRVKIEGQHHAEKEYTLSIGNIDIVRTSAEDSVAVYVGGMLQQNAKIKFVDNEDNDEHSICKKRDIQITFDDGSVVLLSNLIGPSLDTLKSLVGSMKNIYFASNMIDYIAWNIYHNKGK